MRILVTGANGYIGSKLVRFLCDSGNEVIAVDLQTDHIDPRARIIHCDIFNESEVHWYEALHCPDVCIHLAWSNGFVHNDISHIDFLPKHFHFLKNLVDEGLPQLAVMGSMHEVGYHVGEINEETPCAPESLYGIAKNCLRQSLMAYLSDKSVVFQWLRAFYIYGDDDFGNSIFCKIRRAVKAGETRFPFTTGKNEYDFLHIDELIRQIAKCLCQNKVDGIINICSGKPISLGNMVESYIKENHLPIRLDYGKFPDRAYDSPCTYGNADKINRILTE